MPPRATSSPYARARPILIAAVTRHGPIQRWSAAAAASVWKSLHQFNGDDWVPVPAARVLRNLITWVRKEVDGADDGSMMRWAGWVEEVVRIVQADDDHGDNHHSDASEQEVVVTRTRRRDRKAPSQQQNFGRESDEDTAGASTFGPALPTLSTSRRRTHPGRAKSQASSVQALGDSGEEETHPSPTTSSHRCRPQHPSQYKSPPSPNADASSIEAPSTRSRPVARPRSSTIRTLPSPDPDLVALLGRLNAQMSDEPDLHQRDEDSDATMTDAPNASRAPTPMLVAAVEEPVDLIDLTAPTSWSPPPDHLALSRDWPALSDEQTASAPVKSFKPRKGKSKKDLGPSHPAPSPTTADSSPGMSANAPLLTPPETPEPSSSTPTLVSSLNVPLLRTYLSLAAESYTSRDSSASLSTLLRARAMFLRAGVQIPAHNPPTTLLSEEEVVGEPAAMWMLEPLWKAVRVLQEERQEEFDWSRLAGWVGEAMDVVLLGWLGEEGETQPM